MEYNNIINCNSINWIVKRMKEMQENITKKNSLQFLLEESNQCFSQMRHYDITGLSLAKFAFSFYSAIATISFVMERYFFYGRETPLIEIFLGFLLVLTFFIGIMIIMMLVNNRKYFVLVARQVNSIRKTFLDTVRTCGIDFENFLPTETTMPIALNIRSTHLLRIFLFSLINSVTLAFAGFFILRYFCLTLIHFYLIVPLLFVLSLLLEIFYIRKALKGN